MSRQAARDEKREEWERQLQAEEDERRRKASLTLFERVQESDLSDELKEFLWAIDERIEALEKREAA